MLEIIPSTVVCSKHFKKEEFKWIPVNKTLQKDTAPSAFDWSEQKTLRRQISRKVLSKLIDETTQRLVSAILTLFLLIRGAFNM